jgi:hypothetical protein
MVDFSHKKEEDFFLARKIPQHAIARTFTDSVGVITLKLLTGL